MHEFARGDIEFWNNKVYINNTELLGVQNINYSIDSALNNFKYLGMTTSPMIFTNAIVGSLSINKQLWDKDYLWSFTGSSPMNFSLLIDKYDVSQYIGFNSGYLTNYSINFEIGKIPEISAQISTYALNGNLQVSGHLDLFDNLSKIRLTPNNYINAGYSQIISGSSNFTYISGENPNNYLNTGDFIIISGTNGSLLASSGNITGISSNTVIINNTGLQNSSGIVFKLKQFNQVSSNSLELILNEYVSNRVKSASFSADIERIPIYYLGNKYPSEIITNYPIKINCQFELDVDTFTLQNYSLFPTGSLKQQNITFNIKNYSGNKNIMSYVFNNMVLTSESYSIQTEGVTRVNLTYTNDLI